MMRLFDIDSSLRATNPRLALLSLCLLAGSFSSLSIAAQAPTNGLVAYWPFSGNAVDASGNGNTGTVFGATLVPDRFGNARSAYYFDGVDDYIQVANAPELELQTEGTIVAWVKFCTTQDQYRTGLVYGPAIIQKLWNGSPDGYRSYGFIVSENNRIIEASGGGLFGSALNDGNWHFVTIRYYFAPKPAGASFNQGLFDFFVDGAVVLDSAVLGSRALLANSSDPIIIGKFIVPDWISTGPDLYFDGAIDDVRVYNRALSNAEIQATFYERNWPVDPPPPPSVSLRLTPATPLAYCKAEPAIARFDIAGQHDSIRVEPQSGIVMQNNAQILLQPLQTTTYRVTAYSFGVDPPCTDTVTTVENVTVTVYDQPVADAGDPQYVCLGDSVWIGGTTLGGTPPYRWQWSPATGLANPTAEKTRLHATLSGRYQVIVTDANGCADTSDVQISILPPPIVKVNDGVDTIYYCRGENGVELRAAGSSGNPPYSFEWQGENLDRLDSAVVVARPEEVGLYRVTISDVATRCSTQATIVVIPVDPPVADAGPDRRICPGESVVLGAEPVDGLLYQWSPADGLDDPTSPRPQATPDGTTRYVLEVLDTLSGCRSLDTVEIDVEDLRLSLDRTSVDFGILGGCRSDSVITFMLRNEGADDARVRFLRSDIPGLSLVDGSVDVTSGETVELRLRFAPGSAGSFSGRLRLIVDPCGDTLELEVAGSKEEASLALTPGSIDFGRAAVCETEPVDTTITVTNNGSGPADISPALLLPPFRVVSPVLPTTIGAGESLTILVRYEPSGAGRATDDLRLPFAAGPCRDTLRVALSGERVEVTPELAVTAIDFGRLDGCTGTADTTFLLRNSSSLPISITRADLPPGFILRETLPIDLPAGAERSLALRFSPTGIGSSSGRLVLTSEPCGITTELALSGEKGGVTLTHVDTIDFGDVADCALPLEQIFSLLLSTDGGGNGSIESMQIEGPFTSEIVGGETLLDGLSSDFRVQFTPSTTGEFTGALVLRLDPCGLDRRVVLVGRSVPVSISSTDLDLGSVTTGTTSRGTLSYRNTGDIAVKVSTLEEGSGFAPSFRVISTVPALPAELAPGEELRVEVEYGATSGVDSARSTLIAVLESPCDVRTTAGVAGRRQSADGRVRVELPRLSGAAGDRLDLEMRLIGPLPPGARYRAEIAVESSLLVVDDASAWSLIGNERIVAIEGTGERVVIPMIVTLGRVEKAPIRLVSFEWISNGSPIDTPIDTVDGLMELTGLCRSGGVRLFDPSGMIGIRSVAPSPGVDNLRVSYDLSESGDHRMGLIDMSGRRVLNVYEGSMLPGSYIIDIDVRTLSSGSYRLVLETPTLVTTSGVRIAR